MDLNKKVLRKMTVLMLSGVLLSPFVSIASEVVGMDGDHMIGNNSQATMQHESMDAWMLSR